MGFLRYLFTARDKTRIYNICVRMYNIYRYPASPDIYTLLIRATVKVQNAL